MSLADSDSLVTRPLDELAGCVWHKPDLAGALPLYGLELCEDLSVAVGSAMPGMVLLTLGRDAVPVAEVHLSPADVLLLATRLVRMAAAVHEAASK